MTDWHFPFSSLTKYGPKFRCMLMAALMVTFSEWRVFEKFIGLLEVSFFYTSPKGKQGSCLKTTIMCRTKNAWHINLLLAKSQSVSLCLIEIWYGYNHRFFRRILLPNGTIIANRQSWKKRTRLQVDRSGVFLTVTEINVLWWRWPTRSMSCFQNNPMKFRWLCEMTSGQKCQNLVSNKILSMLHQLTKK